MELTQLIVLAVVQTVSEIFPLGAAGHTALMSFFLDWPVTGAGLAVPLRLGLLLAILIYFWRDVVDMISGLMRAAKGKRNPDARLAIQIAVATIPTLGLGFAFEHYVAGDWQTDHVMGRCIVVGAVLLFFFDRMSMTVKRLEHATFADTIVISLCQVIALIPGVGAAAISVIMARMLGYERQAAARLSFFLMAPVLAAVAVRDAYLRYIADGTTFTRSDTITTATCLAAGLIALAILMGWLRRSTFLPFVIYRALLGIAVLAWAYNAL